MWAGLVLSPATAAENQQTIDDWYAANTGWDKAPDGPPSLVASGTITIDDDWLAANADGVHVYQAGARWVVDGLDVTGLIAVATDNVTVRRSRIDMSGHDTYGMRWHPTFGAPHTGLVVEYVTVDGGQTSEGNAFLFHGSVEVLDNITIRASRFHDMKSGLRCYGGEAVEYCWVHDLYTFSGSHNAGGSIRGGQGRIRRNNLEGASSGAFSVYADFPIDDLIVEENLFNSTGVYCTNFGDKEFADEATETYLRDNIYGQKFFPDCGSGVARTGSHWTEVAGNRFMDGTVVS